MMIQERLNPAAARFALGDVRAARDLWYGADCAAWVRIAAARALACRPSRSASDAALRFARRMVAQYGALDMDDADEMIGQALAALFSAPHAWTQEEMRICTSFIIPSNVIGMIAALAPHWDNAPQDVRQSAIACAKRHRNGLRALAALLARPNARLDDDLTALLTHVAADDADTETHGAVIRRLAALWARMDDSERRTMLQCVAHNPWMAMSVLAALTMSGSVLDPHAHALLLRTAAQSPHTSAAAIAHLAPQWTDLASEERSMLLGEAAQHADTARKALAALLPVDGALAPGQIAALVAAVARDPQQSAALIAAIAPHWRVLAPRDRAALLHAAAPHADTAQQALEALLVAHHDMDAASVRPLLRALAEHAWECAHIIAALAPRWSAVRPSVRAALLRAVAQSPADAAIALVALMQPALAAPSADRRGLLDRMRQWAERLAEPSCADLLRVTARSAWGGAFVITAWAPHWNRINARWRHALVNAVARKTNPRAARMALQALLPVEGGLTAAQRQRLIACVTRDACECALLLAFFSESPVGASCWAALDDAEHTALMTAVVNDEYKKSEIACLLTIPDQRTVARTFALLRERAWSACNAASIIFDLCAPSETPRWLAVDESIRRALAARAAHSDTAAQTALAALLSIGDAHARVGDRGELTSDQWMDMMRSAFAETAWEHLDAAWEACAPATRRDIMHALSGVIIVVLWMYRVCDAGWRPPALSPASVAAAWQRLPGAVQAAIVRTAASNWRIAAGFGIAFADSAIVLSDDARRALLRAIVPATEALAALERSPDPSIIAAWLPPHEAALDEVEIAAWQDALQEGRMPMQVVAAVAPLLGRARSMARMR